jgi:Heterokaryon incompatibility protein (HET)
VQPIKSLRCSIQSYIISTRANIPVVEHIIYKMNNDRFPRTSFLCRSSLKQNRTAPYSYIPLNKSAREVRLLTLLPGNLGEDIHVQLFAQTLTQKLTPRYEALSYAWGTAENPVNIYVGNSKNYVLSVSKNLACALDHLRFKETSRALWIDAICL